MTDISAVIASMAERQFRPGIWDCATQAGYLIEAIHGYNPATDYAVSSADLRRELYSKGVRRAAELSAMKYGWVPIAEPKQGALAIITIAGSECFAVWINGAWIAPARRGFAVVYSASVTDIWDTAWRAK